MSVGIEQLPPVTTGQQAVEYVNNFPYLGSYWKLYSSDQWCRGRHTSPAGHSSISLSATAPSLDQQYNQCIHKVTSVQSSRDFCNNLCCWYVEGNVKNFTYVGHLRQLECRTYRIPSKWEDWHWKVIYDVKIKSHNMLWYWLQKIWLPSNRPASVAMQWVPDGGKRRRKRPSKTWRQTFTEDLQEMKESDGVVFAEWPVKKPLCPITSMSERI